MCYVSGSWIRKKSAEYGIPARRDSAAVLVKPDPPHRPNAVALSFGFIDNKDRLIIEAG
jgi:hypothetical protein